MFNRDIGYCGTGKSPPFSMISVFEGASSFDQNIGSWCVSQISDKPDKFDSGSGSEGNNSKQPEWGNKQRLLTQPFSWFTALTFHSYYCLLYGIRDRSRGFGGT
jgi:hypothetical protein